MGDGRDAVCSRREKTTTNSRDEEREEEKKVSQKSWKSGKRTDAESSSFCIFFLRPLSCLLCVLCLPFLFEGKTSFFVVLRITLRDIKTPRRFVAILIMGVLRVKGKDLIAFRC